MSQPNDVSPEQKSATRHFLLNPVVVVIEAVLLICLVIGITMGSAPAKNYYTGPATVLKVQSATKVCRVDMKTADGEIIRNLDMEAQACYNLAEGDAIEVIHGKYKPGIAPRP